MTEFEELESGTLIHNTDNPETIPIPCPHIEIRPIDDVMENVAKHLNNNNETIENLEGEDGDEEFTVDELIERMPMPLMASSQPLLCRIAVTTKDTVPNDFELEEWVVDAISHEMLHIILYHVEDKETSEALDNLSV